MSDSTENIRRDLVASLHADPGAREALEQEHGQVWDTHELSRDFEVLGFMAPYVAVRRKNDGVEGSLLFQHRPRFYFRFQADT